MGSWKNGNKSSTKAEVFPGLPDFCSLDHGTRNKTAAPAPAPAFPAHVAWSPQSESLCLTHWELPNQNLLFPLSISWFFHKSAHGQLFLPSVRENSAWSLWAVPLWRQKATWRRKGTLYIHDKKANGDSLNSAMAKPWLQSSAIISHQETELQLCRIFPNHFQSTSLPSVFHGSSPAGPKLGTCLLILAGWHQPWAGCWA